MRRWEDWERSRLRKLRREEKRKRELERTYPGTFLTARHHSMISDWNDASDTLSIATSEEDQWGTQIGAYNENSSQWAPPPAALLLPHHGVIQSAETLEGDELEAMLEQGFEAPTRPSFSNSAPPSPRSDIHPLYPRGPSGLRYQSNEAPAMASSSSLTLAGYPPSRSDGGYSSVNSSSNLMSHDPFSPTGMPMGTSNAAPNRRERNGGRSREGGEERPSQEGMMAGTSPVEWGPLGPLDPAHNPQRSGGSKLQKKPKSGQI
jgi:chitin synthase